MVISSSGNVGINKDWPMATLDLDGTIKVNSSSLTNNLDPTLVNRALMLDQSDFIVYKTLDDVAFNGEVDGDITNEIQNLSFNSSTNELSLTNSSNIIDLSSLNQPAYWSRDPAGKLYPSTISDKIGIGLNSLRLIFMYMEVGQGFV